MKLTLCFSVMMSLFLAQAVFGQEDYDKWAKEQEKEYKQFVSEQDKEFIGFLKENWINVPVNQGTKAFKLPEPPKPDIFSPRVTPKQPVESPVLKQPAGPTEVLPSQQPVEHPAVPPAARIPPTGNEATNLSPGVTSLTIDFFGRAVTIPQDTSLCIPFTGEISNDAVAAYWNKLCQTDYKILLDRMKALKDEMDLNDWGYCKLIYDIAQKLSDGQRNTSYMFTWFMLVKSGYLARIGYQGNNVYLLVSSDNKLFDVPFFHFGDDSRNYYVLTLDETEKGPACGIFTYKNNYPQASAQIDFGFKSLPRLGDFTQGRAISVEYMRKHYSFPVEYNEDLIKFYRYYPTTNLYVYFASQMSDTARNSLLPQLRLAIHGMNETDAVGFLLHFVQYATGYKTDPEQFGHQKFFFPEESLHYRYSACADRAIFFSYLVRTLVGLKVIGLEYPDHLSAAVEFTTEVSGDYVMYKNAKYTICDPTYIGAPIGQAMPKYLHMPATIVG